MKTVPALVPIAIVIVPLILILTNCVLAEGKPLNSTQSTNTTTASLINSTAAVNVVQCCPCQNTGNATNSSAEHKRLEFLKRDKKIRLARDAKQATAALIFIMVLLVGSVLCTQMWKSHRHLPPAEHSDGSDPLFNTTVSEVISSIRNLRVRMNRVSRPRRKRRKSRSEHIPLLNSNGPRLDN